MILFLYILLACYLPPIRSYLPVLKISEAYPEFNISRIIFVIAALCIVLIKLVRKDSYNVRNIWTYTIVIFFIYVFASVSWSKQLYSIQNVRFIVEYLFTPAFMGWLGLNILRDKNRFIIVAYNVIIVAIFLSGMGIWEFITVSKRFIEADMLNIRSQGTLGNANLLAISIVLAMPSALYLRDQKKLGNRMLLFIFGCFALGIFSTLSRKGIITGLLSPLIYYATSKRLSSSILIGVFAVAVLGFALKSDLLSQRFELLSSQARERQQMAAVGYELFKEAPILGKGFNGYKDNFLRFFRYSPEVYSAHNIYAEALADYGLIGLSLLLTIFLYPLLKARSALRACGTGNFELRLRASVCLSALIPLMISAYFAGGLLYEAGIFYILYSYIAFFLSGLQDEKDSTPNPS